MQTFTSSLQYLEARFSTGVRYIGSLLFTVTYVSNAVWVLAVIPYNEVEYFIYFVTKRFPFSESKAIGLIFEDKQEQEKFRSAESFH